MLKKTLAVILTITTLLALSACGLFSPVQTEKEVMTFDVSEFTETESEVDTTVDTTGDTTEVESADETPKSEENGLILDEEANEVDIEGFNNLNWKYDESGVNGYVTTDEILDFDKNAEFKGPNNIFTIYGAQENYGFDIISTNRSLWGYECFVDYMGRIKEDSENIVMKENAMYGTIYEYTGDGSDILFNKQMLVTILNVTYNDYVYIKEKVLEYLYGNQAAENSQYHQIPEVLIKMKNTCGEDTVLKDVNVYGNIGRISFDLMTGDNMQGAYWDFLPIPLYNRLEIRFK